MAEQMRLLTSRYPYKCRACGKQYDGGVPIWWRKMPRISLCAPCVEKALAGFRAIEPHATMETVRGLANATLLDAVIRGDALVEDAPEPVSTDVDVELIEALVEGLT